MNKEEKKHGQWIEMSKLPVVFTRSPIEFVKLDNERNIAGEISVVGKDDFRVGNIHIKTLLDEGVTHWRYLSNKKRKGMIKEMRKQGLC